MSAELLHQAAHLLRQRAGAGRPGPWNTHSHGYKDTPDDTTWELRTDNLDDTVGYTIVAETTATGPTQTQEAENDLTYLALMHPPVALALADLLDNIATFAEINSEIPGPQEPVLTLARTILREEP